MSGFFYAAISSAAPKSALEIVAVYEKTLHPKKCAGVYSRRTKRITPALFWGGESSKKFDKTRLKCIIVVLSRCVSGKNSSSGTRILLFLYSQKERDTNMICKYCGCETTNPNGVCSACKYLMEHSSEQNSNEIYSSSDHNNIVLPKNRPNEAPDSAAPFIEIDKEPSAEESTPPQNLPTKSRKKKFLWIVAAVLVIAALIAAAFFGGIIKTRSGRVYDMLKNGRYDAAYSEVSSNYSQNGSYFLNRMLESRVEEVYNDYRDGNREYKDARLELQTIDKMNISDLKKTVADTLSNLKKLQASKTSFEAGEKYYSNKNYALALEQFGRVIKDDPNYKAAQEKLSQSRENYRNQALSEAAQYVSNGDYDAGVRVLSAALETLKKDSLIEKRIEDYSASGSTKSKKDVLDAADARAFKEDYAGAVSVLLSAVKSNAALAKDDTVAKTLQHYQGKYLESFKTKLEGYVKSGDYENAGKLLHEAEQLVPENSEVEAEKTKLQGKVPIYLDDLTPLSSKSFSFGKGSTVDAFGNDHSADINCVELRTQSTATYSLSGSGFKKFSFKAAAAKSIDTSVRCRIRVTATVGSDYRYRECEISASSESSGVSLDVTGCDSLTISVSGEGADILMFDAKLSY